MDEFKIGDKFAFAGVVMTVLVWDRTGMRTVYRDLNGVLHNFTFSAAQFPHVKKQIRGYANYLKRQG